MAKIDDSVKKKVPELRFPGFTDDWEERKLSDMANVKTGFPFKNENFVDDGQYLVITNGNIQNDSAFVDGKVGNRITAVTDEIKENYTLNYGDILVTMDGTVGRTAKVVEGNQILAQRVGRLVSESTPEFIYQWLNTGKFFIEMTKVSHGGTIKHISLSEIGDYVAYVPTSKDEREKIGSLFLNIDKTITLHQRKLDLLKEQKKGFLQKMFPKNGAKVPELRFAGFADDWEERKFFESIASTIDFRGRTPKKLGMDWSDSGYLALSALNVKNGYIDPLADAHYGDEKLYRKWMSGRELKKGQVLFTTEAPMGNVAQVPDDNGYILSQRTVAFETKEDMMTNDFLAVLLKSPLVFNNLSALSSGGTAKGVSQKSLKGLSITVPLDIDEQQKIGSFFKQLDDTIALHQRKLDLLKEQKKGFLQKMFV
ncbi:restriction endonuclease subunit S [Lactococcus formosensis]|uniref:restriction endonuclease subunit S n=1 Tax=Lactococcus formosensis TaxID=1281486 RepID=UPI00243566C9|nr:restriction endonuclease subunit S [Lactococcus formosensis]MDG6171622.1 restriction endonuclease subunit S [Lactococcus formosensis]